jgi:hypothetical protein
MKNAFLRASPIVIGLFAMFAIAFAYVQIQPEYEPVVTGTNSLDR